MFACLLITYTVGPMYKELFWDRKTVPYTQAKTHLCKIGYFRIPGVFVMKMIAVYSQ